MIIKSSVVANFAIVRKADKNGYTEHRNTIRGTASNEIYEGRCHKMKNEITLFENEGMKLKVSTVCSFFEHTANDGLSYNT